MSPLMLSVWIMVATFAVLATGIPIAFALALVSTVFFLAIEGFGRVPLVAEQFFNGLQDFGIVTIPMFLLMGIAVAASPAGKDLYSALDRWLNKVPGGLVLSNLGACSIFAALCGSSPATCAAIGKMGIPEMRKRGYSAELAAGTICAGGTLGILIPPKHYYDHLWNFHRNIHWKIIYCRNISWDNAYGSIYGLGLYIRKNESRRF